MKIMKNLLINKKSTSRLHSVILNNILPKCKRSQGEVISTILLILLVISAIAIIAAFAIPFVKNQLSKSDCLEVVEEDKVGITEDIQYSCYDSAFEQMRVQIHIGNVADKINGFSIEIGGASTESFEIINQSTNPRISMFDGGSVELPGKNTEKTYVINGITEKPQTLNIYPKLKNGKTCDSSDSLNVVENCLVI